MAWKGKTKSVAHFLTVSTFSSSKLLAFDLRPNWPEADDCGAVLVLINDEMSRLSCVLADTFRPGFRRLIQIPPSLLTELATFDFGKFTLN